MFKVCLEWDYGQDNLVFTTEGRAMEWVNSLHIQNYEFDYRQEFLNYHDLKAEGLASIQKLTVI